VRDSTDQAGLLGRIAGMRAFRIQLVVLVTVYTFAVFGALYYQSQRLLFDSLQAEAASYLDLVVQTRAWNASHGGVWIEKGPFARTNPYLRDLGITADIRTMDGRELTLRNPSAMTSEISRLTFESSGVTFHLVAEDPLNPFNSPDRWESQALAYLATSDAGFTETVERRPGGSAYRYIELLEVDETCLECHGAEGYRAGEVRGGITINIPVADTESRLARTRWTLTGLALVTLGLAVGASQWFVGRLRTRLDEANKRLSEMAVTDELTGLANRRTVFGRLGAEFSRARRTGRPLSVIALDIDHFKRINDRFGHAVGDAVLREIAQRMRDSVREYDLVGRIGGEEFLVVSPETERTDARVLAERILATVRDLPISVGEVQLDVTASAGVATAGKGDARSDDLVARADDALYSAKERGRDRVVTEGEFRRR